jgi:hypothetical protein
MHELCKMGASTGSKICNECNQLSDSLEKQFEVVAFTHSHFQLHVRGPIGGLFAFRKFRSLRPPATNLTEHCSIADKAALKLAAFFLLGENLAY